MIEMKPLKRSKQRSFVLDLSWITDDDLELLEDVGTIFWYNNDPRISVDDVDDVRVVCEDGYYHTVVRTKNGGITLHIIL